MESEEQKLRSQREYLQETLPFFLKYDFESCYAHRLYEWQKSFLLTKSRLAFLTAANQIGKSSIQIIKCINMATRKDLWPIWFPRKNPRTFVYCYPSAQLATVEFEEKWVKEYLARGAMIDDPRYGWKAYYGDKGQIDSLVFKSGVTVYFRNYTQQPKTLQASTVDAVFLDEECPEAHYDELMVRTQKSAAIGSGWVSMVFTATLGQLYLYNCMEQQGTEHETFKGAWKRQISCYDCLVYADGTPSEIWTREYIDHELIPKYRNAAEIKRRIYGRFIKSSGLVYQEFDQAKNTEAPGTTDMIGWRSWVGIDYGAGGEHGHSSAIVQVKVDPTYSKARVVFVWSSQKQRMTQGDLLAQYKVLAREIGPHYAFADWGAVDLFTLAARERVRLEKAEKSHEVGMNLVNALLKEGQLKIVHSAKSHSTFLIQELQTVSEETAKKHRVDDCSDALRYALSSCPLRLTGLKLHKKKEPDDISKMEPRMAHYLGLDRKGDPMRSREDDDDEFNLAIQDFEDII